MSILKGKHSLICFLVIFDTAFVPEQPNGDNFALFPVSRLKKQKSQILYQITSLTEFFD